MPDLSGPPHGSVRPSARALGLPIPGRPGTHNAITDVPGVEVGYTTLIAGEGPHAIRTGVTAILPRGREPDGLAPVWAGTFALNGNGEMTGTHWIEEAGFFLGPIAITNTHSVGIAHHALVRWLTARHGDRFGRYSWAMPVVAETCDSYLNDMNGLHVTEADVAAAIDGARPGPIAQGNVGGGTGMICYEFKGGTGSASRLLGIDGRQYTVGALVQANHGIRPWLSVLGVPVGETLDNDRIWPKEQGSIIAIVGTDAPLLPLQLKRIARRITLGVGRTGTPSGDNSGDLFLAFSIANRSGGAPQDGLCHMRHLPHDALDPLFLAAVECVEEAILNALLAAETMVGRDGRRVVAIDPAALRAVMRAHNRLAGR